MNRQDRRQAIKGKGKIKVHPEDRHLLKNVTFSDLNKILNDLKKYFDGEQSRQDILQSLFLKYLADKKLIDLNEFVEFSSKHRDAIEAVNAEARKNIGLPLQEKNDK